MTERIRLTFGVTLVLLTTLAGLAEEPAPGSSAELRRRLAASVSVRWQGVARGDALRRLSDEFGVPLWIDRRVDPTKVLAINSSEGVVADLLTAITRGSDLAAVVFDRVVYVGPTRSAAVLAERRTARLGGDRIVTRWDRLSRPRAIAEGIAQEAGLSIDNVEAIPHDLWPAGGTPALTVGDRLTLVLVGFDLRWTVSGRGRVQLESIEYAESPGRLPPLISRRDRRASAAGEQRFTLRVADQPLGPLLSGLAKQLGLTFDRSNLSAELANKRIGFEVRQASLDELLAAVGEAADISLTAREGILRVASE